MIPRISKNLFLSLTALFIIGVGSGVYAQEISNLELIKAAVDQSVAEILPEIEGENVVNFEFTAPHKYNIAKSWIVTGLTENKECTLVQNDNTEFKLTYILNNLSINYGNVLKDGFFGDYLVERNANAKGSFILSDGDEIKFSKEFNIVKKDSVNYDNLMNLEANSLPFTKGEIPPEPLFPGLLEPIIAVGTVVVTVILFFTVRSK